VLGDRQRDAGEFDAAEKSYTEAIGLISALLDKAPGYALLRSDLGFGYGKLGQLYMKRNAPIRARQNFKPRSISPGKRPRGSHGTTI